jgi:uncharacterized protein (DUF1015 family)
LTKILPFRAIRPTRDKAHLVATMPYYTYKKNVLEAKMEQNPYTFLHVINPEFHAETKSAPNSVERFLKTKEKFEDFRKEGIFLQDENPCLYLYRQTKDGHEYLGLIGGASIDQYNSGHIKKHEATLTSREELFSTYLKTVRFNAEPVLLFHERHDDLCSLLEAIASHRPNMNLPLQSVSSTKFGLLKTPKQLPRFRPIINKFRMSTLQMDITAVPHQPDLQRVFQFRVNRNTNIFWPTLFRRKKCSSWIITA